MVPIQASVFTIPKSKVMIYTGAKLGSSNIRNIYLKNVSYEHFPSDEIDYEKYEDYLKVFIYRNPLERFLSGQVQDLRGYFEGYIWHDEIIERRPDLVDRLYQVYTEKKDKVIGHHHSVIDLHNRIHVLGGFKDLNKVHFINLKEHWSYYIQWFLSKQIENFYWKSNYDDVPSHTNEVSTLKTFLIHDERFKKIDFMDNIVTKKYIEDMKKSMEVFEYIEHNNKNRFITKRITKISRKNNFFNELFSI
tara:strand:- start:94 stop:837 length:744 start_codon:yes stop_codon:yes gene_type:complete